MSDVTFSELLEVLTAAKAELHSTTDSMSGLKKELEDGVSLQQASGIADRFWTTREAMAVKVRLFDSFPKQNGLILLEKGLDEKVCGRISLDVSHAFFAKAKDYLACEIDQHLAEINGKGLDCEHTAEHLNLLRRDIARFLCYINWGVYEIRSQLLDEKIQDWSQLSGSIETIESGDYLFLENLAEKVSTALEEFSANNFPDKSRLSIREVDYQFDGVEAVMELVIMFARYLSNREAM